MYYFENKPFETIFAVQRYLQGIVNQCPKGHKEYYVKNEKKQDALRFVFHDTKLFNIETLYIQKTESEQFALSEKVAVLAKEPKKRTRKVYAKNQDDFIKPKKLVTVIKKAVRQGLS